EVVDVVRRNRKPGHFGAEPQVDQVRDDDDEVFRAERGLLVVRNREAEPLPLVLQTEKDLVRELAVQLVTADLGQVVPLRIEKELLQNVPGGVRARRLAGTQKVVDARERLILGLGGILFQRVADDVRLVPMRDDKRLHGGEPSLPQALDPLHRDDFVGLEENLPRSFVDHVLRADLADRVRLPLGPSAALLPSSVSSRTRRRKVALRGTENVRSRSWHSSTEYFGSPRSYRTNSSEKYSRGSLMGKTLLKTS